MSAEPRATRSGRVSRPVVRLQSQFTAATVAVAAAAASVSSSASASPSHHRSAKSNSAQAAVGDDAHVKREDEEQSRVEPLDSVKRSPRKRRKVAGNAEPSARRVKQEDAASIKGDADDGTVARAVKKEDSLDAPDDPDVKPKQRRSRKRAAADASPEIFPPRILGSTHHVGAHISSAGGVENAPLNALRIGGNAFSLFVRPKMQWASKPLTDTNTSQFHVRTKEHGYGAPHVVPHGCYLINLANPDEAKRAKSFEAFMDDLQRCEALGVALYNFHPGSTVGECTKEEGCRNIADAINKAHGLTKSVTILIENMAGAGNLIGGTFEELRDIIGNVTDKSRVGICLDTCHAFAAGYDMTSREAYDATMSQLASTVGFEFVKAVHLNDSKTPLGSHKDRHENIGAGHLGLFAFYALMNDERFAGIPLILETPGGDDSAMHEVWKREVAALYSLQGLPPDPTTWTTAHALLSEVQEIRLRTKAEQEAKKARLEAKRGKLEGRVEAEESGSD
ncbi:uncharacterized protein PFL1_00302 [Pseudozyma flocculosa PF-1]|uniref:uncharacterized protein n=1 Tax=Pseudozyma flocculosa PF-1 TaxID=1277687 RepID=UPI00045605E7|nr:uncharacterized protein PFL1_00302 [Pseudozyma flocculosa PF-1]EPQ32105.1 hypothetical protein PFL1_00302 [Pseudozyma flocculosa PF-1]